MQNTIISKNFRKLRLFKGLNQTDFAELFSISRSSVGSYEEGRAEPKLETLLKVADYFKLTVDEIIRKELTVNQIARFENPIPKSKNLDQIDKKIDELNKKISRIETLLKTKKTN